MAKRLTLDDLIRAKEMHGFEWTWKPGEFPPKRTDTEKGSRTYLQLYCGKCHNPSWVEWGALKRGASKCCRDCSKLPTIETLRELAEKFKTKWVPTHEWKMKNGRRYFWMICECKEGGWVKWNSFRSGKATGCRSCASPLKTHGLSGDPIYRIWRDLLKNYDQVGWKSFVSFNRWAKPLWLRALYPRCHATMPKR